MLEYRITEDGYRITQDGKDLFVQEGKYATVYPGETIEERAKNHIADLKGDAPEEMTDAERLEMYEKALNDFGVETEVTDEA